MSTIKRIILPILLLGVVLAVFWPTLSNDFVVWDDDIHLLEYKSVRSLDPDNVREIFSTTVNKIYIPLTSLSFALEYHYFEYDPFIYHLTNLILHMLVTLMVYLLARRLRIMPLAAAIGALIFGIHPMHVESVAWITERKDVLYAFFYMLALLAYMRHLTKNPPDSQKYRIRYLVLSTFFAILSMLAKPMALSLPLILLLLDWFEKRGVTKKTFLEKIPLFLIVGFIAWLSYKNHMRIPGSNVAESFLTWVWTFVFYIRQFVFPFILVPIYRQPAPVSFLGFEYMISILIFVLTIFSLWRLRRFRWFVFAVCFYFLSIFFLLRFDNTHDINVVADRFMYLPSVGFCFLLGLGAHRLLTEHKPGLLKKTLVGLAIAGVILIYSFKAHQTVKVWKDGVTLWGHQLKYFPNEYIALNGLAENLQRSGAFDEIFEEHKKIITVLAEGLEIKKDEKSIQSLRGVGYLMGLYHKAIARKPNYMRAYYNLAKLNERIGLPLQALIHYNHVITLNPIYRDVFYHIGNTYSRVGKHTEAIDSYIAALRVNSTDEDLYLSIIVALNQAINAYPEVIEYKVARKQVFDLFTELINSRKSRATSFFNLGYLYGEIGEFNRAISAYQAALKINPAHSRSLYNLANIYKDLGNNAEAIALYEKVIKIDPKLSDALINIGIIYHRENRIEKAREYYKKAIDADSGNSKAYFNLAYLQESGGKYIDSIDLYNKAIELDPQNSEIYYNLGNVFTKLERFKEAVDQYKKTVSINPNHMNAWINLSVISYQLDDYQAAVRYLGEARLLGYDPPEELLDALRPYM